MSGTNEPTTRCRGRVALVGAGPGSPDLITMRGARLLGEADLVLYDALASEAMRAYAPSARWFFVGKRADARAQPGSAWRSPSREGLGGERVGAPTLPLPCRERQSIAQETLNRLLVRYARRGLRVVRLKCGDPFVFGRGGEEALALARAGIPFEVVPGVSSAVAAPALAGIPVTHRGAASALAVVTGHHEAVYAPLLDAIPPGAATVVVLMGLGRRAAIAERLRARGWPDETPAAIVLGAATPQSWSWIGRLADLGAAALPGASAGAPGVLVIGAVVGVAAEIAAGFAGAPEAADPLDGDRATGE